jgi:prevent-host-death family protein
MIQVSVTELRQHLPAYLKRVEAGEEIRITSRGRVVARIQPEQDPAEEARLWLENLRGSVALADVVRPLEDLEWTGDANHL